MISAFLRTLLFISSYFPVLVIFTILGWPDYGYLAVVPLAVGVVGVAGIVSVGRWVKSTSPLRMPIATVHRRDAEALAYLVTYVLPFLDLNLADPGKVASLAILFVTLAVIYVNADMLHINPTLNLLGWHVYEVETPEGRSHLVISRRKRILKGDELYTVTLADGIQWERSDDRGAVIS